MASYEQRLLRNVHVSWCVRSRIDWSKRTVFVLQIAKDLVGRFEAFSRVATWTSIIGSTVEEGFGDFLVRLIKSIKAEGHVKIPMSQALVKPNRNLRLIVSSLVGSLRTEYTLCLLDSQIRTATTVRGFAGKAVEKRPRSCCRQRTASMLHLGVGSV